MEGQKIKIVELPELEGEVLNICLVQESFDTIVEECTTETKQSVIADAIKNLLHLKMLVAVNQQNSMSWIYDSDKMVESSFKATSKGIEWIKLNSR